MTNGTKDTRWAIDGQASCLRSTARQLPAHLIPNLRRPFVYVSPMSSTPFPIAPIVAGLRLIGQDMKQTKLSTDGENGRGTSGDMALVDGSGLIGDVVDGKDVGKDDFELTDGILRLSLATFGRNNELNLDFKFSIRHFNAATNARSARVDSFCVGVGTSHKDALKGIFMAYRIDDSETALIPVVSHSFFHPFC